MKNICDTHHATIVGVIDLPSISVRAPQSDLSCRTTGLHALKITQVLLIGREDVREASKVGCRDLASVMIYGHLVLKEKQS